MKVRVMTDLTKYNPLFTLGAIGDCDMKPFQHPRITWEECYNVIINGHSLAIGESGIQEIGEDDSAANVTLINEKIDLGSKIDSSLGVALWYSKDNPHLCKRWELIKEDGHYSPKRMYPFYSNRYKRQSLDYRQVMSDFVHEYCVEGNIPFMQFTVAGSDRLLDVSKAICDKDGFILDIFKGENLLCHRIAYANEMSLILKQFSHVLSEDSLEVIKQKINLEQNAWRNA